MEKIEHLMNSLDNLERENSRNDYLRYLRNWPWFVLSCAIGLIVGVIIFKTTPETYQVESRLLVSNEDVSLSSELSFEERWLSDRTYIVDQIGILQSYSLFRQAIENLNWETTWLKKDFWSKQDLYKSAPYQVILHDESKNLQGVPISITALNDKEYLLSVDEKVEIYGEEQNVNFEDKGYFNKPFKNEYFYFTLVNKNKITGEGYSFYFNNKTSLTAFYQNKVTITTFDKESELVLIQSEGQSPQRDADFLNELNKVYINFGMEKKNLTSENSVNFIQDQANEINQTLKQAEEKINNYRKSNSLMNLGQEANLIYTKLSEIENEKYESEQLLDYYQELERNIDSSEKIGLISSPSAQTDSNDGLNTLVTQLTTLYNRREVLSISVRETSPNFIQLNKEIDLARNNIKGRLKSVINTIKQENENINQRYRTIQGRLSQLPETEKNLIGMQRDYDVNNELYNFLLKKKAEAAISHASIIPQAKIIDPAMSAYAKKLGPKIILFVLGGLFLGLIIPFLIITLSGFFNNRIESLHEIESKSQIPIINEIVQHKFKSNVPVINNPRSGIAESFRNLKMNLTSNGDKIPQVISINSMISGEGKTFVSANLSSIFALSNKKVLLVGTDLRNPKLHSFLKINKALGLSNYLRGENSFDEVLTNTEIPNLYFVEAGPIPSNPTDLLESVNLKTFISTAREEFDFIILDNAPLLLVPDAICTNKLSDLSLFVFRLNYSRKDEIRELNNLVKKHLIKNASVVINCAVQRGYGYGKRYWKNGYGEKIKNVKTA